MIKNLILTAVSSPMVRERVQKQWEMEGGICGTVSGQFGTFVKVFSSVEIIGNKETGL